MATTPRKPVPPKTKIAVAKPAPKRTAAPRKPTAPKPATAPKLVAPKLIAAEAPKPVPVIIAEPMIIAEPVTPPAPAKLTLVSSAPAPLTAKAPESMMKGYEDLTAFGKDNFDALVKANALFAKGLEDFGREVLTIAQAHMEEATMLAKAMLHAKTLNEVVEMHTKLTKSSIEKLVAESSMLSELGMKLTNEAMAPINARVTVAVEKIKKLAAA